MYINKKNRHAVNFKSRIQSEKNKGNLENNKVVLTTSSFKFRQPILKISIRYLASYRVFPVWLSQLTQGL